MEGKIVNKHIIYLGLLGINFSSAQAMVLDSKIDALIQEKADKGDPEAQYQMATFYARKTALPNARQQMMTWYERAAQNCHEEAQYELGRLFEAMGKDSITKDSITKAIMWYKSSAEQGNVVACNKLARWYEDNRCKEKSEAMALLWHSKAIMPAKVRAQAEAGYLETVRHHQGQSAFALATYYENEKAYAQAAEHYAKCVDFNPTNHKAQCKWAMLRINNHINSISFEKALDLLDIAATAEKPDPRDMCCAGTTAMKLNEWKKAEYWLKRAIAGGNNDARYHLALVYEKGYAQEVAQNKEEALSLLKQAVLKDSKQALEYLIMVGKTDAPKAFLLAQLYQNGVGVEKKADVAVNWGKIAADLGHVEACYLVGQWYEAGAGADRNESLAIAYYKKAALGNNKAALDRLIALAERSNASSECQYILGQIFESQHDAYANRKDALKWYRLAAQSGGSTAAYTALARLAETRPIDECKKAADVVAAYNEAFRWFDGAKEVAQMARIKKIIETLNSLREPDFEALPFRSIKRELMPVYCPLDILYWYAYVAGLINQRLGQHIRDTMEGALRQLAQQPQQNELMRGILKKIAQLLETDAGLRQPTSLIEQAKFNETLLRLAKGINALYTTTPIKLIAHQNLSVVIENLSDVRIDVCNCLSDISEKCSASHQGPLMLGLQLRVALCLAQLRKKLLYAIVPETESGRNGHLSLLRKKAGTLLGLVYEADPDVIEPAMSPYKEMGEEQVRAAVLAHYTSDSITEYVLEETRKKTDDALLSPSVIVDYVTQQGNGNDVLKAMYDEKNDCITKQGIVLLLVHFGYLAE